MFKDKLSLFIDFLKHTEKKKILKYTLFLLVALGIIFIIYFSVIRSSTKINRSEIDRLVSLNLLLKEEINSLNKRVGSGYDNQLSVQVPVAFVLSPGSEEYLVVFYANSGGNECSYSLSDLKYESTPGYFSERKSIDCRVVPGISLDSRNHFGWLGESKFFLDDANAQAISIFNLKRVSRKIETETEVMDYSVFNHSKELVGISRDVSKLMWLSQSNGSNEYTITNRELVQTSVLGVSGMRINAVFSSINNGVLFIEEFSSNDISNENLDKLYDSSDPCMCNPSKETCNLEWKTFKFYDFSDQSIDTLITSSKKLSPSCGHGCSGPILLNPKEGEISLYDDCFSIDKKYYDENSIIKLIL